MKQEEYKKTNIISNKYSLIFVSALLIIAVIFLVYKYTAPNLFDGKVSNQETQTNADYVVWSGGRFPSGNSDIYLYQINNGMTTQVTETIIDEIMPRISGDYVVWESRLDGDWEIYLYQISKDKITQITDNSTDDVWPEISGDHIVWHGDSGGDSEIYLYQISSATTTQITNNSTDEVYPQISGDYVVWEKRFDDSSVFDDCDIYLYQISKGTITHISKNTTYDRELRVNGNIVAWAGIENEKFNIYLYQISSGITKQVTSDLVDYYILYLWIDGDYILWDDPKNDNVSYVYCISTGTVTEIPNLNLNFAQRHPVSGDYVVGTNSIDGDSEIYLYQIHNGKMMKITNNKISDSRPQTNGHFIVWLGHPNEDWYIEVYLYDIDSGTTTRITTNEFEDEYPYLSID